MQHAEHAGCRQNMPIASSGFIAAAKTRIFGAYHDDVVDANAAGTGVGRTEVSDFCRL